MPRKAAPFWSRVQKSDGCWTWVGHLNDGYGVYGHSQKAHRVSWILSVGPLQTSAAQLVERMCAIGRESEERLRRESEERLK